jgi:hypothetical protein
MNKVKLLFFCTLLFFIRSYGQAPAAIAGNHVYKNKALGWTIRIPHFYSAKSEQVRPKVADAAAKSLNVTSDKRNTELLLSFKKDGADTYPTFLSGLQNKNTIGTTIKSEEDFIKFISTTSKKVTQKVVISTFRKKIGNKEFYGYQLLNPDTKIYQKGLIKIIDKWIFYQTWIFDNEEDQKNLENAVFTATFESGTL